MSKLTSFLVPQLLATKNIATMLAGLSRYANPMGGDLEVLEQSASFLIPENCHITKITAKLLGNLATSNSTITLRKNGSNTSLTITYASLETGVKTSSTPVDATAGDTLSYLISSGTVGALTDLMIGAVLKMTVRIEP